MSLLSILLYKYSYFYDYYQKFSKIKLVQHHGWASLERLPDITEVFHVRVQDEVEHLHEREESKEEDN